MSKIITPELVTIAIIYGCLMTAVITDGKINVTQVMGFAAGGYYGYLRRGDLK